MRDLTLGRVILVAAIALIGATGLCLVHADEGVPDLCLSLLGVTVGPLLAVLLGLAGSLVPARVAAYSLSPLDRPAPPPKTA
jgi:hypothetical protein